MIKLSKSDKEMIKDVVSAMKNSKGFFVTDYSFVWLGVAKGAIYSGYRNSDVSLVLCDRLDLLVTGAIVRARKVGA